MRLFMVRNDQPLIIVPAYNEEQSVAEVLRDLHHHGYKNVVVIDDGSADKTGILAKQAGAVVLHHRINRGLGAALGTGFAYANSIGANAAVTFDSDGQHRARDIKSLLKNITNDSADVVIGSRLLWKRNQIPKGRLILNYLSNLATYCLYGVWATDTLSGLRAFNKKALESITIKTQRMEVSNEFFKEIRRNKLRYLEIPVEPIYTDYSRESSSQGQFPQREIRLAAVMILRMFR